MMETMDKLNMQVHFNPTRKEHSHHPSTDTRKELNNILSNDNRSWNEEKQQCYNTQAFTIQRAWRNYKDRVSLDNKTAEFIQTSQEKESIFQSPSEEEESTTNHAMSVSSTDEEFSRNSHQLSNVPSDVSCSLLSRRTMDSTSDADDDDDDDEDDESISSTSSEETMGVKKNLNPLCIYEENDNMSIYNSKEKLVKRESNEELVKMARKQSFLTIAQEFATFKKSHPEALPFNMHKQLLAMFSRDVSKSDESSCQMSTDVPDVDSILSEKEKDENEKNILLSKDGLSPRNSDIPSGPNSKFTSSAPDGDGDEKEQQVERFLTSEMSHRRIEGEQVDLCNKEPRHHSSSNKHRGCSTGTRSGRGITRMHSTGHVAGGKRQGQHGKSMSHHRAPRPGLKLSSPELLGGFDVYNIETAMPTIDWKAMEEHLAKAAKEEEFLRRAMVAPTPIRRRLIKKIAEDCEYVSGFYKLCFDEESLEADDSFRLVSAVRLKTLPSWMTVEENEEEKEENKTEKSLLEWDEEENEKIKSETGEEEVPGLKVILPEDEFRDIPFLRNGSSELKRRFAAILQRRNDREEIRRRLAMGSDTDEYYGGERITRKPSLQTRLQSGMNLQICFMNETANDPETSNGDQESEVDARKVGLTSTSSMQCNVNAKNTEMLTIPANLSSVLSSMKQCGVGDENMDFGTRQAKLQAEARMALAQAKEMAHMQMEVEKQRKKKSPIAEMVGMTFPASRRRTSRQLLNDMNVAQLQVIVNDLHTQIETLNEELVRLLLERDDLHMEQDSMLVDIEDLTRYLGAKDQAVKEKETKPVSLQKQMKSSSPILKLKLKK